MKGLVVSVNKTKEFSHPSEYLKWIAILTMLVDHVGHTFFPGMMEFRMIGRIAFPIFTFFIAIGYMRTSNITKYYKRLILFAFLSQIPYTLLFHTWTLNVLFTLFIGLLIIHAVDKKKYVYVLPLILIPLFIPIDYGLYGALLPLIFYLFLQQRLIGTFVFVGWTALFIHLKFLVDFQVLAVIGVLLAYFFPSHWTTKRLPRYFVYGFYPVHMLILYLLRFIM